LTDVRFVRFEILITLTGIIGLRSLIYLFYEKMSTSFFV